MIYEPVDERLGKVRSVFYSYMKYGIHNETYLMKNAPLVASQLILAIKNKWDCSDIPTEYVRIHALGLLRKMIVNNLLLLTHLADYRQIIVSQKQDEV